MAKKTAITHVYLIISIFKLTNNVFNLLVYHHIKIYTILIF